MRSTFISVFAACLVVALGNNAVIENYRGTGNNFGSGYRSDGNGGITGTGNNFGSGYRSDGNGGATGTGKNLGSGHRNEGQETVM